MAAKKGFPTFSGIIGYSLCASSYHSWRKMDEKQAILRLKQGDISGLEALVALHQVRAVRAAYLITHDEAVAEEVTQEAFLQAYRSIRHFDQDRPFGPWFLRSVVHAAVKVAQRDARHAAPPSAGGTLEELFAADAGVEDQDNVPEEPG
jgi:RNA polymerase sigma-70 factor (ECF subfamily)